VVPKLRIFILAQQLANAGPVGALRAVDIG
jgi:hypothetical protein